MTREGCFVDFEPIGRRVLCRPGVNLLTLAREAGISIAAVCGGKGTCGRCRVKVLEGEVSPLSATERWALKGDAAAGWRLACQTVVQGPAKVHVPAGSLTARQRTQVEGRSIAFELDPPVRVVDVSLSDPALTDLRSDAVRLRDYLRERAGVEATYDVAILRQLSDRLREDKWQVRAVLRGNEVVALLHPGETPLGLAVDLGTTKVAAYLVDMVTGVTLASEGVMNPQISYGEDVMARIAYALEGAEEADTLRRGAVTGLADLAVALCNAADVSPKCICEAVVVGNTAMHHLFLGLPVRQLGNAPYLAATSDELDVKARDVGFAFAPGAYVHLLPNIAGFVGADHVAMILATGLYQARETTIALDIGTNTEIALYHEGRLVSCSTASGPAFEGAHIRFGMRATDGAVERVTIDDGSVRYQTINDRPAVGICGSGILDAVAQLYRAGVLDMKGGMTADHARVRDNDGGREFVLVPAAESAIGEDIVVTRGDVGQIQLAKGAMRSGINVLLQELGITAGDIKHFIVAGAFGSYIDVQSAIDIAMFPEIPLDRFEQVGNAAGAGARMALLSGAARARAVEIAKVAHYIELTNEPRFVQEFMTSMFLTDLS
ncbi:MAG: ASKHA domain-containing protein [Anaerolineae bacterium]